MTRCRSTSFLLLGLVALALVGCASNSDGTADTQSFEARQVQTKAQAQARAAHLRAAARRQARIRARRAAHHATLRQTRAEQRRTRAEEAEALRAEEEATAEEEETSSECDPNYSGACLSPTASDYDCAGGSGDGPEYTGTVTVTGEDHYGLDSDYDGIGCEPE